MNWNAANNRRRIHQHGAESINSARSAAAVSKPDSARRKASPLTEAIVIDRWWRNRGGDAVYVRLSSFKERNLIDIRSWRADSQGISQPGKGIALAVKHLPRLHAAIGKALSRAIELGLIATDDDGTGE
jgi:hypothetical protein